MNKIQHSKQEEKTAPKLGSFYLQDHNNETFLLAKTEEGFSLLSLFNGHPWSSSTERIEDVFDGDLDFSLVTEPFTITPCSN